MFEKKFTDYDLSPVTGMTRQSWLEAGKYLLEGAFAQITSPEDPMIVPRSEFDITYPHKDATGARLVCEKKAEIFEGLTRTFFIASAVIGNEPDTVVNGIRLRDYYAHQVLRCTDPADPLYVGDYDELQALNGYADPHRAYQQTVETAALVIGLDHSAGAIWNRYTKAEKDQIAAFLAGWAAAATVPQNWRFFNCLDLAFLYKYGYEIDETVMEEHVQALAAYYAGDGWYRDGQSFDYYSEWAFNVYAPLWCRWYGYEKMPETAAAFETHSHENAKRFPLFFDRDGWTNMWGRSCIYRNAATAPLAADFLYRTPAADPGLARKIVSGSLLQFLERDDFLENGVPAIGFYGAFPPMIQGYSCAGSVYWLGKAFLCLALPGDSPFWRAKEPTDVRGTYEEILDGPGLAVSGHTGGDTILRSAKVLKSSTDIEGMMNYAKLAYSTKFPWEAYLTPGGETEAQRLAQAAGGEAEAQRLALPVQSQMYSVIHEETDADGHSRLVPALHNFLLWHGLKNGVLLRRAFFNYRIEQEMHWTDAADLADFPVPGGIFRADRLRVVKKPATITLGSFGFPDNGAEVSEVITAAVSVQPGTDFTAKAIIVRGRDHRGVRRAMAMTVFFGFDDLFAIRSTGTNADSKHSIILCAKGAYRHLYDGSEPHMFLSQVITKELSDTSDSTDSADRAGSADNTDSTDITDIFTADELFPVASIEFADRCGSGAGGNCRIILKTGEVRQISFDGLEGRLMI